MEANWRCRWADELVVDPERRRALRSAGRMSAVGWEFAAAVVGCLLLGWWADKKLGTSPWLSMVGLVLGSFAGFWTLFKAARELSRESTEDERSDARDEDDRGEK